MERKERSRSRSPIIMKSVDESTVSTIDGNGEHTETKQRKDIANQEPLQLKDEPNHKNDNIVKLDQTSKSNEIELDSEDEDDGEYEIAAVPVTYVQKHKPTTILHISNLPLDYTVKRIKRIMALGLVSIISSLLHILFLLQMCNVNQCGLFYLYMGHRYVM